jgi:hypothetical protein
MHVCRSFRLPVPEYPSMLVSTPRSSNRTCGSPASGSPTGFERRPTNRSIDSSPPALVLATVAESLNGVSRQHGQSPDS